MAAEASQISQVYRRLDRDAIELRNPSYDTLQEAVERVEETLVADNLVFVFAFIGHGVEIE